jgi:hypothetical protein
MLCDVIQVQRDLKTVSLFIRPCYVFAMARSA